MPNGQGETAADYAHAAARDAAEDARAVDQKLDRLLGLLVTKHVITQAERNKLETWWT